MTAAPCTGSGREVPIASIDVSTYRIPTDQPESDGTLEWRETTLILVQLRADRSVGIGYTYADAAVGGLISDSLAPLLRGHDALAIPAALNAMLARVRNLGRPGLVACAISALDAALWDLKARLLDLPLVTLLGVARAEVPVYASGGFTSYSCATLERQLSRWAESGISRVKMKVGRQPERDPERVRIARKAVGAEVELFVDANGAYAAKQALACAERFAEQGVTWFEEPVSSDDLAGLRLVRERAASARS